MPRLTGSCENLCYLPMSQFVLLDFKFMFSADMHTLLHYCVRYVDFRHYCYSYLRAFGFNRPEKTAKFSDHGNFESVKTAWFAGLSVHESML